MPGRSQLDLLHVGQNGWDTLPCALLLLQAFQQPQVGITWPLALHCAHPRQQHSLAAHPHHVPPNTFHCHSMRKDLLPSVPQCLSTASPRPSCGIQPRAPALPAQGPGFEAWCAGESASCPAQPLMEASAVLASVPLRGQSQEPFQRLVMEAAQCLISCSGEQPWQGPVWG